jgi:hypothetical protein
MPQLGAFGKREIRHHPARLDDAVSKRPQLLTNLRTQLPQSRPCVNIAPAVQNLLITVTFSTGASELWRPSYDERVTMVTAF